jgi:hypothetical protein
MDGIDLKFYPEIKRAKDYGLEWKKWHNRPSFLCNQCPYDDLNLDRLLKHIQTHNQAAMAVRKKTAEHIVDRHGNHPDYQTPLEE